MSADVTLTMTHGEAVGLHGLLHAEISGDCGDFEDEGPKYQDHIRQLHIRVCALLRITDDTL